MDKHTKNKTFKVFVLIAVLLSLTLFVYHVLKLSQTESHNEASYLYSVDSTIVKKFLSQGSVDSDLGNPYITYPIDVQNFHATLIEYPFGSYRRNNKSDSIITDTLNELIPRGVVLYVHGFNDYFFQKEMAEKFDSAGYAFFAIDLHSYGRSILQEQPRSDMLHISEHYPELDYAIAMSKRPGVPFILMGHSQGGLIASLYTNDRPNVQIDALVLNSPFLEMNYNALMRNVVVPIVAFAGLIFPNMSLGSTGNPNYAYSLYKDNYGEWDYNTNWKPFSRPITYLHWVRAIYRGQKRIRTSLNIKAPTLVMHSTCSIKSEEWVNEYTRCDAILDAELIRKFAPNLGTNVKVQKIEGAIHDILLSKKSVRQIAYDSIFKFLNESIQ